MFIVLLMMLHPTKALEAPANPVRLKARFDRYPLDTLPSHHGYKQLAIILEKRGDYVAACALSEQAREQGWKGDWDARIARLNKRSAKLSN